MRIPSQDRKSEEGQAAVLVIVALAVFLIGGVGLAIDGSHLYAERQMAQSAADAAAQAGIRSVFTGSYANGSSQAFSGSIPFTCATSDARTPCYYAQTLNGFNTSSDTVTVSQPTAASLGLVGCGTAGTPLFCGGGVNLLQVSVSRQVPTTLFKFIGSWTPTVMAQATGAIVSVMAPVPIIVTHPWLAGSFSTNGTGTTPKITICGGPNLSIQVNSVNSASLSGTGNPVVDLSKGGPNDPGNCTTGTGSSFGDWGGPSPSAQPYSLSLGTTGQYIQPAYPISDPLAGVSPPSQPAAAPAKTPLANGVNGCTSAVTGKACNLYYPGTYSASINVQNETAVFSPGIYYMNGVDFSDAANGFMTMATGLSDTTTGTGWTGNMLVYMTGASVTSVGSGGHACTPPAGSANQTGQINIQANGTVSLVGSPANSSYLGMLFFVDRNAVSQSHTLGGGGNLSLIGTVYMPETVTQMGATSGTTCSQYQSLSLQGNSGSSTNITGEVITSVLTAGGTSGITMSLNPNAVATVRQIALVQ